MGGRYRCWREAGDSTKSPEEAFPNLDIAQGTKIIDRAQDIRQDREAGEDARGGIRDESEPNPDFKPWLFDYIRGGGAYALPDRELDAGRLTAETVDEEGLSAIANPDSAVGMLGTKIGEDLFHGPKMPYDWNTRDRFEDEVEDTFEDALRVYGKQEDTFINEETGIAEHEEEVYVDPYTGALYPRSGEVRRRQLHQRQDV